MGGRNSATHEADMKQHMKWDAVDLSSLPCSMIPNSHQLIDYSTLLPPPTLLPQVLSLNSGYNGLKNVDDLPDTVKTLVMSCPGNPQTSYLQLTSWCARTMMCMCGNGCVEYDPYGGRATRADMGAWEDLGLPAEGACFLTSCFTSL